MHHRLRLGNFVVAARERDQLPLTAGGAEHLVDPLTVVGNQSIRRSQNRGRRAVVLLKLHHRARGIIRRLITEIVLKAHQDREVGGTKAIDALIGIAHNKNRTTRPVVVGLRLLAIRHQQLDQVVLGAIGVLIFIHQHMAKTSMPVPTNLFVLLEQLNR